MSPVNELLMLNDQHKKRKISSLNFMHVIILHLQDIDRNNKNEREDNHLWCYFCFVNKGDQLVS